MFQPHGFISGIGSDARRFRRFASVGLLALALLGASAASGQTIFMPVDSDIPDTPTTLTSTIDASFGFSQITSASSISVHLTISAASGGSSHNGDYVITLEHNGTAAVLLNRVGLSSSSDAYTGNGLDITLQEGAPNIHTYESITGPLAGTLTGTWGPDGRGDFLGAAFTEDPVTNTFDVFTGFDPNGQWNLRLTDYVGDSFIGHIDSWSLTITGAAIAEPGQTELVLAVSAAGALLYRRYRRVRQTVRGLS